MPYKKFDRDRLVVKKLHDRRNKINIEESHIPVSQLPSGFSDTSSDLIKKTAGRIRVAREKNSAVILDLWCTYNKERNVTDVDCINGRGMGNPSLH